jgi:hypothetical protein
MHSKNKIGAVVASVVLAALTLFVAGASYAQRQTYSAVPGEVSAKQPVPPRNDRTGYEPPRRIDGIRESVLGSEGSGVTHVPGVDSASSRFTAGGAE